MSLSVRTLIKQVAKMAYLYSGYIQSRNALAAARGAAPITVLTYHRVDHDPADYNAISPEIFDRQMACLKKHYRVIGVRELLEILRSGQNLERSVVITFDDGYRDNLTNAAPILRKHGLPACFFLSSGFIGTDRAFPHDLQRLGRGVPTLSWDEVWELRRQGFDIGSHTVNHTRLSECDDELLRHEIEESKVELERHLAEPVPFFSYPFGLERDFSSAAHRVVKAAGYACCFTCYGGLNNPTVDPYAIRRLGVANADDQLSLRVWVEGWKITVIKTY